MATSATKLSASQNSIKYLYAGTGVGSLLLATILTDCEAGALKEYLKSVDSNALWGPAWTGNAGKLSVTLTQQASLAADPSAFFSTVTNRHIDINQAAEGDTVLEIRFNPTPVQ